MTCDSGVGPTEDLTDDPLARECLEARGRIRTQFREAADRLHASYPNPMPEDFA